MIEFNATRAFVRDVLEHWERYEWTLQGFGMLRAYITRELRLHVWSRPYQVENVTLLHDHPWDFTSLVVSGRITNRRWIPVAPHTNDAERFKCATIVCGPGGCARPDEDTVWLKRQQPEFVFGSQHYRQRRDEIHDTDFLDGTVTLIERKFYEDTEHARVYYVDRWVSAEPRRATADEIDRITGAAIGLWDGAR